MKNVKPKNHLQLVPKCDKSIIVISFFIITHSNLIKRNVFITKDNHIKLGDLGVAKSFDKKSDLNVMASTFAGTFKYMSPEMKQQKNYSFKTDIW